MQPPNAPWIGFLRKYGPVKTNVNSFDEMIELARRRANVEPINVAAPRVAEAVAALTDKEKPYSVILTGDAGDGKTYHCRQIWNQLGGSAEQWDSDDGPIPGVKELKLGTRLLWVVRDLSELDDIKRVFFAALFKELENPIRKRLFLIAANVGQLHERWKAAAADLQKRFPSGQSSWLDIEAQLFGREPSTDYAVRLFHLGRGTTNAAFKDVLNAVLDHPAWEKCSSCELKQVNGKNCPILENRSRFRDGDAGKLFRDRLSDLVLLNAQNQRHFTIRQILMLIANSILGHPNAPKDRLLRCDDISSIHTNNWHSSGPVYSNVLGENLVGRPREAFLKLTRLGLGKETSNLIDRLLCQGPEDPALVERYQQLIGSDVAYGDTSQWRQTRLNYLETGDAISASEFNQALRAQRQRLFFTVPDALATELGIWELTVYHHAGEFLDVVDRIAKHSPVSKPVLRQLVRGVNRVFTGRLVSDDDRVVLATSGHDSQARTSLLFEGEISIRGDSGESVQIAPGRRTAVSLVVTWPSESADPPVQLDLSALRFEFLSRVGHGALPSSFSLECHEDILAFKARLLRAFDKRRLRMRIKRPLRFLEVADDGHVRFRSVDLASQ
jgi:hypothetical protein